VGGHDDAYDQAHGERGELHEAGQRRETEYAHFGSSSFGFAGGQALPSIDLPFGWEWRSFFLASMLAHYAHADL